MTITNAVLLTAALARDHFPERKERTTPRNLAMSSGLLNILLAPFGAIPMCHGAGGLAAMRAQGARTGLAPIVFGVACLVAALALGVGHITIPAVEFPDLRAEPIITATTATFTQTTGCPCDQYRLGHRNYLFRAAAPWSVLSAL